MRLVGTSLDCYNYLEPLYNDYRKIRRKNKMGRKLNICLFVVVFFMFHCNESLSVELRLDD